VFRHNHLKGCQLDARKVKEAVQCMLSYGTTGKTEQTGAL